MSLLTSILSLVKPQTTDGVDELRIAIGANADILDTAVRSGDARLLTTALQAALAGTSGTPGSGNKFVTHADIGAGVQAHDADLDLIAALSTTSYGRALLTAAAAANMPGGEIGYDQFTAPVAVTVTASGLDAGTTVLSCAAHTFDGAPAIAHFSAPQIETAVAASAQIIVALYEGATEIGRLTTVGHDLAGGATMLSIHPGMGELRFTPSAGSHSYTVFATQTGGTATIAAGPGGTNQADPGFVRFTKV